MARSSLINPEYISSKKCLSPFIAALWLTLSASRPRPEYYSSLQSGLVAEGLAPIGVKNICGMDLIVYVLKKASVRCLSFSASLFILSSCPLCCWEVEFRAWCSPCPLFVWEEGLAGHLSSWKPGILGPGMHFLNSPLCRQPQAYSGSAYDRKTLQWYRSNMHPVETVLWVFILFRGSAVRHDTLSWCGAAAASHRSPTAT